MIGLYILFAVSMAIFILLLIGDINDRVNLRKIKKLNEKLRRIEKSVDFIEKVQAAIISSNYRSTQMLGREIKEVKEEMEERRRINEDSYQQNRW